MKLKSAVFALLLSITLSEGYANKGPASNKKRVSNTSNSSRPSDPYLRLGYDIQRYAKNFLKTTYVWGGTKPGGFDCSGLVRYCYKQFGMELTQSSADLFKLGYQIPPLASLPGDMIFFRSSSSSKSPITHVGMILEVTANNRVKFIHAARSKGVIVSFLDEPYFKSHFASVNRVMDQMKNFKYEERKK